MQLFRAQQMADDFDFDPASPAYPAQNRPHFNPVQEQSVPYQQPQTHAYTKQKKPTRRTRLPPQLAKCNDCFELRAAYRYLLEYEREMKKILKEKYLQVKKYADLLVKADAPDVRGKQVKEQIRVLESQIALTQERIGSIVVGDVEAEKQRYLGERSKQEEDYLRFLADLEGIKSVCQIVYLYSQNSYKSYYLQQLQQNMEKKQSGKVQLHRVEVKNARNQIIACKNQISELKQQRQRNYDYILRLYEYLTNEFKCDLSQLFSGQVYEFRYLDLQSAGKETEAEIYKLLFADYRPKSPPGEPACVEIDGFDRAGQQLELEAQHEVETHYLAEDLEQALEPNDVPNDEDFDQSDHENVEDQLMKSIK